LLVLLRNSTNNHNTWGLPGGNADREDDGDLMRTAVREAQEELTVVPEFEVLGEVCLSDVDGECETEQLSGHDTSRRLAISVDVLPR
jgi:8-oxo-dGTP pyrophosphatase MutT (NUDIX family)